MERRWGSHLTVFVAPGAVPWWLLLLSSACLWCPRSSTASSRRARAPHANLPSVRELIWALGSSSESLSKTHSRPVLLRRTVLKPQLLLFVTCMREANALRKSKWKGELLLVKAHSCESSIGTVAGERSDEVQLVQAEAVLVVGVSTACSAVVISSSAARRRGGGGCVRPAVSGASNRSLGPWFAGCRPCGFLVFCRNH